MLIEEKLIYAENKSKNGIAFSTRPDFGWKLQNSKSRQLGDSRSVKRKTIRLW